MWVTVNRVMEEYGRHKGNLIQPLLRRINDSFKKRYTYHLLTLVMRQLVKVGELIFADV